MEAQKNREDLGKESNPETKKKINVRLNKYFNYDNYRFGEKEHEDQVNDFHDLIIATCARKVSKNLKDEEELLETSSKLNSEFMKCSNEYSKEVDMELFLSKRNENFQ